jgi:DNA-binding NtrC family response regulator
LCRVLIVDDEESVRAAIERRLKRDGLNVHAAADESDAIEKIMGAEKPYDVVMTDMVMENPDSGLNVLKAAMEADIFTEVIILTAYGNIANAVESMKRGAFDYVEKNIPGIDVYDLMSIKIAQAIERRQSSMITVRRIDQFARTHEEG